jgi:hypothetical protein
MAPKQTAVAVHRAIPEDDPLWQAALRAPVVEETPEERAHYEQALALGGFVDGAVITAEIERRRRECENAGE